MASFQVAMAIAAASLLMMTINVQVSQAATCNPMALSPCATAILAASPPTSLCCTKLREQRPCLCSYLKNPNLKKYITSANAQKVALTCKAPFPNC
ncbi:hypothetical protein ACLOJK_033075 [Asimina triloba]